MLHGSRRLRHRLGANPEFKSCAILNFIKVVAAMLRIFGALGYMDPFLSFERFVKTARKRNFPFHRQQHILKPWQFRALLAKRQGRSE